jgi:nitrilase
VKPIRGDSAIVSPFADVLVGPVYGRGALLCADIDLSDTIPDKYDPAVVGHYAPPDVFGSHLDTRKQTPVRLGEECKSHARDE